MRWWVRRKWVLVYLVPTVKQRSTMEQRLKPSVVSSQNYSSNLYELLSFHFRKLTFEEPQGTIYTYDI